MTWLKAKLCLDVSLCGSMCCLTKGEKRPGGGTDQASTKLCCLSVGRSDFGAGWRNTDWLQLLLNKVTLHGFNKGPPEAEACNGLWGGSVAWWWGRSFCFAGQTHGERQIGSKRAATCLSTSKPVTLTCICSQCRENRNFKDMTLLTLWSNEVKWTISSMTCTNAGVYKANITWE